MSSCGCNNNLEQAIEKAKAATNSPEVSAGKRLDIDLMYIDLSVCDRCQGTEQNLEQAIDAVKPLLRTAGFRVNLRKLLIENEEQAQELRFASSPTIRINGQDIQLEAKESHCSSCSSLVDDEPVDCRSWTYLGDSFDAPPTEMIIEAIVQHVFEEDVNQNHQSRENYTLPENLRRFFAARQDVNSGGTSSGCSNSGSALYRCGCHDSLC